MGYELSMEDHIDLPDGWEMTDDLANKISGVINKKPSIPDDELQNALEVMAQNIALSNLIHWIGLGGFIFAGPDGNRGKEAEKGV